MLIAAGASLIIGGMWRGSTRLTSRLETDTWTSSAIFTASEPI